MVIAALICFGALLLAWIVAPDESPCGRDVLARYDAELAPAV